MFKCKKILALVLAVVALVAVAVPAWAATIPAWVTGNSVAFRTQPSLSSTVLYRLNNGTRIDLLSLSEHLDNNSGEWFYYAIYNNQYGYICSRYVTQNAPASSHPQTMAEAFGPSDIHQGARGVYVKNVQYCLYLANYLTLSEVDGIYGNGTQSALIKWQRAYGQFGWSQNPAGYVGTNTKNAFWNLFGTQLTMNGYR